jgi:hypothetical protein
MGSIKTLLPEKLPNGRNWYLKYCAFFRYNQYFSVDAHPNCEEIDVIEQYSQKMDGLGFNKNRIKFQCAKRNTY